MKIPMDRLEGLNALRLMLQSNSLPTIGDIPPVAGGDEERTYAFFEDRGKNGVLDTLHDIAGLLNISLTIIKRDGRSLMHEGRRSGDKLEFNRLTDSLSIHYVKRDLSLGKAGTPGTPKLVKDSGDANERSQNAMTPEVDVRPNPVLTLKGPCERIAHLYGATTTHKEGWTLVEFGINRPAGNHWLKCMEAAKNLIRPEQLKALNEEERSKAKTRLGLQAGHSHQ